MNIKSRQLQGPGHPALFGTENPEQEIRCCDPSLAALGSDSQGAVNGELGWGAELGAICSSSGDRDVVARQIDADDGETVFSLGRECIGDLVVS